MNSREKKYKSILDKNARENFEYFNTAGFQKMWNYALAVSKTDHFQKTIADLKQKYEIPSEGFDDTPLYATDEWRFVYPPRWKYYSNKRTWREVQKALKELCGKYQLHYMDWHEVIGKYLFYNRFEVSKYKNSFSICRVADLIEEKKEQISKQFEKDDDMAYPIAIRVSPYASQRDIVDFVKKSHPQIEVYQKSYRDPKIKIGKVKSKKEKTKLRSEFIYQYRHLPRKQIMRLVNSTFNELLDYGHIGKIISLETKKRKEV